MDWDRAIERNREALKRIVASLVAMAGLVIGQSPPLWGRSGAVTLPRHLHRAVLRLLRPAEAAARRLVIVIARELPAPPLPPSRPRKPAPKPMTPVLRSLGLAVFLSPADAARAAASARRACTVRKAALPLFDPTRLPRPGRPRIVPAHAAPRILSFGGAIPHRLPPPPSPRDPIDASRVGLRLEALASALDDLPAQARRFARWKVARDAAGAQNKDSRALSRDRGRFRRISPLRPGRPPGLRSARSGRPAHEVHGVLGDLHYFAFKALQPPDTS